MFPSVFGKEDKFCYWPLLSDIVSVNTFSLPLHPVYAIACGFGHHLPVTLPTNAEELESIQLLPSPTFAYLSQHHLDVKDEMSIEVNNWKVIHDQWGLCSWLMIRVTGPSHKSATDHLYGIKKLFNFLRPVHSAWSWSSRSNPLRRGNTANKQLE